jgi:hypothetical protein
MVVTGEGEEEQQHMQEGPCAPLTPRPRTEEAAEVSAASPTTPVEVVAQPAHRAVATPVELPEILGFIRQARDALHTVGDPRVAVTLVRQATAVDELVDEALKDCHVLAEEQFELRQEVAEVHLRTQRRAGQLLARCVRHGGGRPARNSSNVEGFSRRLTLQDLRIDPHESHRWQRIASVPCEMFEAYIEASLRNKRELTTSGILAIANRLARETREDADTQSRPSAKPALLREYDHGKRAAFNIIWLDPWALAAAMDERRRRKELEGLSRLRIWIDEFERSLRGRQHPLEYEARSASVAAEAPGW